MKYGTLINRVSFLVPYLVLDRRCNLVGRFDRDGLNASDRDFKIVDSKIAGQQKRARQRYFRLLTSNYIAYQKAKGTLKWKP